MNDLTVVEIGKEAIYTLLIITTPLLIAAMMIGLIIGLIQTLTQVQEMTLVFVPKILLVFIGLLFLLPFMIEQMRAFSNGIFDRIVALGT